MTTTYGAASGNGTICNGGMSLEAARRRAQEIADRTNERASVFTEPGGYVVEDFEPQKDDNTNATVVRFLAVKTTAFTTSSALDLQENDHDWSHVDESANRAGLAWQHKDEIPSDEFNQPVFDALETLDWADSALFLLDDDGTEEAIERMTTWADECRGIEMYHLMTVQVPACTPRSVP